ncbi:SAM-dependent methyltransferase [Clostridium novyi A str. BKT29909]|uniref:class I SAM-dependent methyltransferase n=1 Tax=Clostridium novyi TaxID=1542 RepID=UPI0004D3D877|nr:rRNA adenine N-6-methyltransferase family protein [Clostridium novyi]KEH91360.1 SAM-dependent methyltransferase [Clostridium novyi A str. BKT29909]
MRNLLFLLQYIIKPRTTGAVMPSSKYLARKMVNKIDFKTAKYIVEYGPGTGVFTDEIIKRKTENTILLLIEYNTNFYNELEKRYTDIENLYIINGSAENIDEYLKDFNIPYIDYVVSGLPFASLPRSISSNILRKTMCLLKKNGKFITFQYTLFMKDYINRYFSYININKEYRNIPPAYVLNCSNR